MLQSDPSLCLLGESVICFMHKFCVLFLFPSGNVDDKLDEQCRQTVLCVIKLCMTRRERKGKERLRVSSGRLCGKR
jgi:hypothetical protein